MRTASLVDLYLLGRWDEALSIADEQLEAETEIALGQLLAIALIHCERGDVATARAVPERGEPLRNSSNPQNAAGYHSIEARVLRAEGRSAEALSAAERALAHRDELANTEVKRGLVESVEAALDLHDLDKADELLGITEALSAGELTPYLQAHSLRLRARIDAGRGKVDQVDEHFRAATALYREFDLIFHQAVSQLEHADWLTGQGHADEALAGTTRRRTGRHTNPHPRLTSGLPAKRAQRHLVTGCKNSLQNGELRLCDPAGQLQESGLVPRLGDEDP